VCSEAYVVVSGRGELHALTTSGASITPLDVGTVAWFSPGTVHRAVNVDDLKVIVVMGNGGLPEAGDAVLTFPPEILRDPERYAAATALDPRDLEGSARRRRDLAVAGYLDLVERVRRGDREALDEFYECAAALVRPKISHWRGLITSGPARAVAETLGHLDTLESNDLTHFDTAAVEVREPPKPADRSFGMCGRLDTYPLS
jgi:hypothetical protein